jgi:hypothetical protein
MNPKVRYVTVYTLNQQVAAEKILCYVGVQLISDSTYSSLATISDDLTVPLKLVLDIEFDQL